MNKYSKNQKLNNVLMEIENYIIDRGEPMEDVKANVMHYYKQFKNEPDYNFYQYGNMLIWNNEIYNLYANCGYKSIAKMSVDKVVEIYKRQVGYVIRNLVKEWSNNERL